MRIAINATSVVIGGGVTYLFNFLESLAKIDSKNIYYILINKKKKHLFKDVKKDNFRIVEVGFVNYSIVRLLWEQIGLPIFLKKKKIDVLYSPANISSLFAGCKSVILFQSLAPYFKPPAVVSLKDRIRLKILCTLSKYSLKKVGMTIFPTLAARNFVIKDLGIPEFKKSVVVYYGVDKDIGSPKQSLTPLTSNLGDSTPYLLFVSNIYFHKNLHLLLKAFNILVKGRLFNYNLRIIGQSVEHHYYLKIKKMVSDLRITERVEFLGSVEHSKMSSQYRQAKIFVFPSLIESFGFPLLEAMASAVPVVASDIDVCHEICQNAAIYFDPRDPRDLADKILKVLQDNSLQQQLRNKALRRSQDFSWEKTARETLAVFEKVYNL